MSSKLKFDEMKDNHPSKDNEAMKNSDCFEDYPNAGNNRNLCFVKPNGDCIFLNYSYLIAGEFFAEESKIILSYTSQIVILSGTNLEDLYKSLLSQIPRKIICSDSRYESLSPLLGYNITGIRIDKY